MRRNSNKRMSASTASFPLEHRALRQICRGGIALKQERVYWWPVFVRQTKPVPVTEYPAAVKSASSLLAGKGVRSFDDVFQLLCQEFDLQEPSVLQPLFRLVSSEFDTSRDGTALVYMIFSFILSDSGRFSDFTMDAVRGNNHAFRKVLEKNMPKTHRSLSEIGALEDDFLALIFRDFFKDLLSRPYYSTILDGFMLEGVNMLLRYAMGLVFAYKKEIKAGKFKTGPEFWSLVKQQNGREKFAVIQDYAFETEVSFTARMLSMKYALSNKQISNLASQVRSENSRESGSGSKRSMSGSSDGQLNAKVSISFAANPIVLDTQPADEEHRFDAVDNDDRMHSTPASSEFDTPEKMDADQSDAEPPASSQDTSLQLKDELYNDKKPLVLPRKHVQIVGKRKASCCPC